MNQQIPLVPMKCDLTSFPYLPIEVEKFTSSYAWISFNDTEKVAHINLLFKSWHQIPCSSLPNDDVLLAHYAAVGRRWTKVKKQVLSEWKLAIDNRYYHPYVAQKALEAWLVKLNASIDANMGNEKRWDIKIDNSELIQDLEDAIRCLKQLFPTSKSLENNVLKAVKRSNKFVESHRNLSGGDRNKNQLKESQSNRTKNNLDVNSSWSRQDDFLAVLEKNSTV